jgi:hypothetical protein
VIASADQFNLLQALEHDMKYTSVIVPFPCLTEAYIPLWDYTIKVHFKLDVQKQEMEQLYITVDHYIPLETPPCQPHNIASLQIRIQIVTLTLNPDGNTIFHGIIFLHGKRNYIVTTPYYANFTEKTLFMGCFNGMYVYKVLSKKVNLKIYSNEVSAVYVINYIENMLIFDSKHVAWAF